MHRDKVVGYHVSGGRVVFENSIGELMVAKMIDGVEPQVNFPSIRVGSPA
jgi:hypothetical protein